MSIEARLDEASKRAYAGALRLLGDPDAAREACQEAASRALRAANRYDPSKPFYPWYHQIVLNLCRDILMRRRRQRPLEEGELERMPADATKPDAEQSIIARERQEAVRRAMLQLPAEHRSVIALRHFRDLSYAEMAVQLGCPEGTVMSRLYRARQALRAILLRDEAFSDSSGALP
ncbi:MAG: RNA polymerase sigma factor [Myxococcota bacterium]|jgi:RNA polymerase sigma-70 factor (ECF subfamily)|nr:RNA polymerase sigma factor [Myxococcota bacterium]